MKIRYLIYIVVVITTMVLSFGGCGGGGGGGASTDTTENNRIEDTQALENAPLTKGGTIRLTSTDSAVDDASITVPPGAVDQDVDITFTAKSVLPVGSPWGLAPVGSLFELEPSGLTFDADKKALIRLPIPPGSLDDNLYIGRWNETTKSWENVGGTIDGDFISAEVDHLSLYGIFSKGKSLVRMVNGVDPAEDPSELGIEIRYISGPVPPSDWPENEPYPAYRPLPAGGIELKIYESQLMMLPPGQYHFLVSYPNQIANSLWVRIPVLSEGADDGGVDQTIVITEDGASSDDSTTNASLDGFPGSQQVVSSNLKPVIGCTAIAPQNVPVFNLDPAATGLPSHVVGVGPIVVSDLDSTAIELLGTAVDPEGSTIKYYWTWSQYSTLPANETAASGVEVSRYFRLNPKREGNYTVSLTAYDQFDLFDECRWDIQVRGNDVPTITVIADDYIVDYGRLGAERINGDSAIDRSRSIGLPPGANWCDYNGTNTTWLRRLPILPESEDPDHIYRPTQYPPGMTCVYALVGDRDNDPLAAGFFFPFGGDLYNAVTGDKIITADQLDAYNTLLSNTRNDFPVPPILAEFDPQAQFALPIIWEAPDNMTSTLTGAGGIIDPGLATHDCRHLHWDDPFIVDAGPCVDIPGTYPDGGITEIEAAVTDGFSRWQIDGFGVGYGEDDIVRLKKDSNDSDTNGTDGTNTPPTCSDGTIEVNQDASVTLPFYGSDADLDPLEYSVISGPSNGFVEGNTYTPDGTYYGEDSLTYVADDGKDKSATCTIVITVKEVGKWFVFKLSGTGYKWTYGMPAKVTGYEYQARWLLPSQADGFVGTDIDNTEACKGPSPYPSLSPQIWETRSMEQVGMFDTYEETDSYHCDVPTWITGPMICNGWTEVYDDVFWDDIIDICGL